MLFLCFIKAFHFGMPGETNSDTPSISGKGSKFCDSRSKSLSSFCSVPPWSVTLFYIERSCLVSWRAGWSDAPTLPYPSTSELSGLESIEDEYRCGNWKFLANAIALRSKDLGGTLSMTGNYIIELSCRSCQVHSSRCPFGQRVRFVSKPQRPHLFREMQVFSRNQWRVSLWILVKFTPSPRVKSQVGHAWADCCWEGRLLPPVL